jgi:hypothetical protein
MQWNHNCRRRSKSSRENQAESSRLGAGGARHYARRQLQPSIAQRLGPGPATSALGPQRPAAAILIVVVGDTSHMFDVGRRPQRVNERPEACARSGSQQQLAGRIGLRGTAAGTRGARRRCLTYAATTGPPSPRVAVSTEYYVRRPEQSGDRCWLVQRPIAIPVHKSSSADCTQRVLVVSGCGVCIRGVTT